MKQLSEFEKAMLKTISHNLPYTQDEVKRVYLNTRSFDKTVFCLRKSIQLAILPDDLYFDMI